ncbi:MAG: pectin acetylesterase-family hydrolase [Dehalococcoidia bacterium]
MHKRGRKLAVLLVAGMLAAGLAALVWTIGVGPSEAQEGAMQNCPKAGGWAISVWSGDDDTAADQAFATCTEAEVIVAYSIDPDTQTWLRWLADEPPAPNTLTTLDDMQGVIALGGTEAPETPDLPAGWTKIEPGGDTICSQGTPYAFWVHPGTVNRLLVYFQGGGACWNDFTCSDPGTFFADAVDENDNPENWMQGIGDLDNPDNPFKDWFLVFVPYCTADVHWGDTTHTYTVGGTETEIHHKGFVNVSAVLDWIEANFEKPEKIFVTGCSAGSYGSVMGAAHIHALYPDVPLYQLGDAGAGVITDDFFQNSFPNWGAVQNLPDWIPALQVPWAELTMAKIYIALANYYSEDRWSQYNTAYDEAQIFFYAAMGGSAVDWTDLMMASMQEIQENAPNFHSYIAPGSIHCITHSDIFYTREVEGVKFSDWVKAMVNDEEWDDVLCTDCETDPEAQ